MKQDKSAGGLPVSRIETIWNSTIDKDRLGYAGLTRAEVERWLLEPGDILFSHINSLDHLGKVAIYEGDPPELVHGMNLLCFRANREHIDPRYLLFVLRTQDFRARLLKYVNQSVNQVSVSLTSLRRLDIPLPPLEEQKRIAAVLDKADDLRGKRRQALATLDTLLQSVFLDMFGDPVTNPKRLPTTTIDEVATYVSSGVTPRGGSEVYQPQGVMFIRSQNVLMGRFDFSDAAFIDPDLHQELSRSWVKRGDVLLNITGASIGRVHWYDGDDDSANVNQHVCIIRPNQAKFLPEYVAQHLAQPSFQAKNVGQNTGATRQAFNFQQIRRFVLLSPPLKQQERFVSVAQQIAVMRERAQRAALQADTLFATLQSAAFAGTLFNGERATPAASPSAHPAARPPKTGTQTSNV